MKKKKKDLEETLKEKVGPLLEESMEKQWGITIPQLESDISDQLKKSQLNLYVPTHLNFKEAKKIFKVAFLKNELWLHRGNISQLAKSLDIDRRSVHRAIKELEINIEKLRDTKISDEEYQEKIVGKKLRSALHQYEEIIQPQQMEKMYEEVPKLSRNIAKFIPHQHLTLKEAEQEFEKQFLEQALQENEGNISKTAVQLEIRAETLHRKIKKLGLNLS